jgi:hypothetical protein
MSNAVLLDTSFFIRLLKLDDPLFTNADGYFRYFLENDYILTISTISIGEYCTGGSVDELPLKNLQILPYNFDHAKRAGEFAKIVFENKEPLHLTQRRIIPNDTKLFAQADTDEKIGFYLSSDMESFKIYSLLRGTTKVHFEFLDLHIPYNEAFGVLGL